MKRLHKFIILKSLVLALCMTMPPLAQAHLMVAQHGTLNIVDNGAFMVLSLPISAFEGVDDDGDGSVSMIEFNHHRGSITEAVRLKITLQDAQGPTELKGIMLSPETSHHGVHGAVSQLTVMGRFSLNDPTSPLRFSLDLFGKKRATQLIAMTARYKTQNLKAAFELTPAAPTNMFFFKNG